MKLALASSSLLALAAAASSSDPTCECQPFPPKHTSYQVTRLWNIIDPSMTDQDVIDEFNEGFAPIVTHMEGFQRYTASSTGNSTTVFFLNEFATKEEAHVAQVAAKEFVANGRLNGKISPNIFTEAKGLAVFPLEGCIKDSSKGQFLAVRFYHYLDPTSVNTTTLYPLLKEFYDKSLRDKDGFVTYYSALNPPNDGNDGISWDIFESEEAAIASNEAATTYAAYTPDFDAWPPMETVTSIEGSIAFDYTCAAGNLPEKPAGGPPSAAFSAGASGSVVATVIFAVFWGKWLEL